MVTEISCFASLKRGRGTFKTILNERTNEKEIFPLKSIIKRHGMYTVEKQKNASN